MPPAKTKPFVKVVIAACASVTVILGIVNGWFSFLDGLFTSPDIVVVSDNLTVLYCNEVEGEFVCYTNSIPQSASYNRLSVEVLKIGAVFLAENGYKESSATIVKHASDLGDKLSANFIHRPVYEFTLRMFNNGKTDTSIIKQKLFYRLSEKEPWSLYAIGDESEMVSLPVKARDQQIATIVIECKQAVPTKGFLTFDDTILTLSLMEALVKTSTSKQDFGIFNKIRDKILTESSKKIYFKFVFTDQDDNIYEHFTHYNFKVESAIQTPIGQFHPITPTKSKEE